MNTEYRCPLTDSDVDETVCYDIQMVTGPGNLINKSILADYGSMFDTGKITDERAARYCSVCPFNQLKQSGYGLHKAAAV